MTYEKFISKVYRFSDKNWERLSNPCNSWQRFLSFFAVILAFWSRAWGCKYYWVLVVIAFVWMFFSFFLFKKPKTTKSWMSKAILGVRVWAECGAKGEVPKRHKGILRFFSIVAVLGTVWYIYGIVVLSVIDTVGGLALVILIKMWFADRLVWLYEDMKGTDARYKSWEY